MEKFKVTIKGTSPLFQNKILVMEKKLKKGGEDKDCPDFCPDKLYMLNKKIVQPSEMILRAMTNVAGQFTIKGSRKKSYRDLIAGCLKIEPEFIEHKNQKWVVDERTVVIPATKGRINRYRPRFDSWELNFDFVVTDNRLTEEIVKMILDDTGRICGIGDGRKIGMGRFMVTEFKSI